MAGGQERVLRRRIRSVQSTRKITKAMELIAASQIVRAQARIAANRPYREGMARIVRRRRAADPAAARQLLGTPESPSKVGVLAIVADRGLCRFVQHLGAPGHRAAGGASTGATATEVHAVVGGQEGASRTSATAASRSSSSRSSGMATGPRFADARDGGRRGGRPVRGGRDGPGA